MDDEEDTYHQALALKTGATKDGLITSKADREMEKERKREAKKDLKFYDEQPVEYE